MALTNAAGPWLCCCAFAATVVRPIQATQFANVPVSKIAVCPHCRTTNDDKNQTPIPKPVEPIRHCMPGVTPVIPAVSSAVDNLPTVPFTVWEATVITQTVNATVYVHVRLTPLLTSDERVRTHHVMTC